MNSRAFEQHTEEILRECFNTLDFKAGEYAADDDRLHNFRVAAGLQQTTPVGALGGMMAKHTISIYDMIRGDARGVEYPVELWAEKIKDHINYLLLLWAAVQEGK